MKTFLALSAIAVSIIVFSCSINSGQPDSKQLQANRILYEAAGRGDIAKVNEQLALGADVNSVHEPDNMSPLILAAENNIDVVRLLIGKGANLDWQDRQGKTALIKAVYANKIDTVKLLIKSGAKVSMRDQFGDTALMSAVFRGEPLLVEYLLAQGDSPLLINHVGDTPLIVAKRLVGYVEKMDDSDAHAHHQHTDDDHVVVDKNSALVARNEIIRLLSR